VTTLHSDYRPLVLVRLPYAGRQLYMHSFDLAAPTMPAGYEDYKDPVTLLCIAAGARVGTAHMTVDEKVVSPGMSQRRPKPHVDGCFVPRLSEPDLGGSWVHPSPGSWLHTCNEVGGAHIARMSVIVAASEPGCRAWRGEFHGEPKADGDLSHIADQLGEGEVLPANVAYLLSPDCVHESMVLDKPTQRTFLRIALPVEFHF
jgi:hypothetical protein